MALANMGPNSLIGHATQCSTRPVRVRSDRKYPRSERKLNPEWLNSYWQTDLPFLTTTKDWRCYLKERGYYHKPCDSLSRLKELAKRCVRGLKSYDAHDVKTLRALALSRGGGRVQLRFKKQELIRFLETADDWEEASTASPTFHRFSELPPELRNRVYTFYFQSLGKVPPRFAVPPLCRTSRQLQLETTGLFFEQSTFIISMRRIYCRQTQAHKAQLHYHSEVAKSNIPMPNFAQIKHLHVELKACSNGSPSAVWTIDLTEGRCARERQSRGQHHEESVQTLVDSIMARQGLATLEKGDLDKLEVAITKDYNRLRS